MTFIEYPLLLQREQASSARTFRLGGAASLVLCLSMLLHATLAQAEDLLTFEAVAAPVSTPARVSEPVQVWKAVAPPVSTPARVSEPVQARNALAPPVRASRSGDEVMTFAKVPVESDAGNVAFTPVAPPVNQRVAAGNAPSRVITPAPAAGRAAPAPADAAQPPLPGVSALALSRQSSRLTARQGAVAGPSERELREIFHRAVQAAAERSPKVQRAHAEHAAADADIDEAKGQRWPQVDLGTTAGSKRFGSGSENNEGGGSGINLNVVTPVYDWGRIRKTIDSRQHLSEAATASIEAELESSAFDVSTSIVELGKQRIIVDISQQYVDRMNELVKMLAGIVAVDRGRTSELTQAKARLLQAQAARDTADSRARDAELNLRKLVGDRPIAIPRNREWSLRLVNLDMLLAKTEDHPAIHQAKAQAQSAELQAEVVRASSLPQLNWVVSKSTAEDSLGREQPWETHLAVTWGAFRGGSARASERAALQRAEAGRQETEQQRLDLEYRVRAANHDAKTFLERSELYRDLTVESEGIRVAFYEQWYHLGKRTLLDVLSAESDHYGNKVNEITNRFDGYQAILRQYAGAGSLAGWLRGAEG